MAAPIYIALFSTYSPKFIICGLLHDSHSDSCEVTAHCDLDLQFSNDQ